MPGGQFGQTRDKAGALVNVSPRSVTDAKKVLQHGCDKLIALVDAGELAVSAAARLASLGGEKEKFLAERAQELETRAVNFVIKALKRRGLRCVSSSQPGPPIPRD